MSSETIKAAELDSYDFGEATAPEGFDPNAEGREDAPVGKHVFIIKDFEIAPNNTFKGKDFGEWIGNQLRPKLVVADNQPHAGTSMMDFLPLPSADAPMPKALANRFANFIRSFGFQPPPDRIVPKGFNLKDLIGKTGMAEIVDDTYEGKTRRKVKFFGYSPIDENGKSNGAGKSGGNGKSNGTKPTTTKPATPTATTKPAAAAVGSGLNLDDL